MTDLLYNFPITIKILLHQYHYIQVHFPPDYLVPRHPIQQLSLDPNHYIQVHFPPDYLVPRHPIQQLSLDPNHFTILKNF